MARIIKFWSEPDGTRFAHVMLEHGEVIEMIEDKDAPMIVVSKQSEVET